MVKNILKNKLKLFSAVILGLCLTFSTSMTALAKSDNVQVVKAQVQSSDNEKLLLNKQSEIDRYVFEQHAKDIEQKGFKVTHTGQANGYVEIGIAPFTKENADYLYKLFGKELVKIVEGQQAGLMNNAVSTTAAQQKEVINTPFANPLVYIVIIAAAIGGITLIVQKRKAER